jgi:hypothetical protein
MRHRLSAIPDLNQGRNVKHLSSTPAQGQGGALKLVPDADKLVEFPA